MGVDDLNDVIIKNELAIIKLSQSVDHVKNQFKTVAQEMERQNHLVHCVDRNTLEVDRAIAVGAEAMGVARGSRYLTGFVLSVLGLVVLLAVVIALASSLMVGK